MNPPPPYNAVPTNGHESLRMGLEFGKGGAKPQNRVLLSTCPLKIRQDFIRKVYSILFLQIVATTAVTAGIFCSPSLHQYLLSNAWIFYGCLVGALSNTAVLVIYQHTFPANYLLLASFTIMEAVTLGVKLATLDYVLVLQALIITIGVFLGLTLFTLQSKWDFSGLGPFLYAGSLSLIMTGIARSFVPFGSFENTIHALAGSLVFSGFIIHDTSQLIDTLSPDEFIWASLRLYLDVISLFIYILRLLMEAEKKKQEEEAKKKKEAEEKAKKEKEKEREAKGKGKQK